MSQLYTRSGENKPSTLGVGGDNIHVAAAAEMYGCRFRTHQKDPECRPVDNGTIGPRYHILYWDTKGGLRGNHYDVLIPQAAGPHRNPDVVDLIEENSDKGGQETQNKTQQGIPTPPGDLEESDWQDNQISLEDENDIPNDENIKMSTRPKLSTAKPFTIVTYNVGGSRDAIEWILQQGAQVVMIQEHRIAAGK